MKHAVQNLDLSRLTTLAIDGENKSENEKHKKNRPEIVHLTLNECLKKGEEVSIAGLGIFEAKTRAGRTGRNPRTGATIQIKAMKVPKFRASKTLKDAVK